MPHRYGVQTSLLGTESSSCHFGCWHKRYCTDRNIIVYRCLRRYRRGNRRVLVPQEVGSHSLAQPSTADYHLGLHLTIPLFVSAPRCRYFEDRIDIEFNELNALITTITLCCCYHLLEKTKPLLVPHQTTTSPARKRYVFSSIAHVSPSSVDGRAKS